MILLNNVGYIDNIQNLHIIETVDSGENELVFEIAIQHEHYKDIFEEMQFSYASQNYTTSISSLQVKADSITATVTGHTTSIATLNTNVAANTTDIAASTDDIAANTDDIATMSLTVDGLSTTVSSHTGSISTLTQNANGLSSTVSSQGTTISGHTTILSSHTASIASQGTTISGHTTTLSSHTTSISTLTQTDTNFTAAFKVVGATGYTRTGKTVISATGLTVYDGALKIYDSSSNLIFDASSSGVIYAKGSFRSAGTFNGNAASTSLIAGGIIMYVGDSTTTGAQLYCGSAIRQVVLEEKQRYEIVVAHATTTAGETWFAWGGNVRYQFGYNRAIFSGDLTLGGTLSSAVVSVSLTNGINVAGKNFYMHLTNIFGVDRYVLIANP